MTILFKHLQDEGPASQASKRLRVEQESDERPLPRMLSGIVGGRTPDHLEQYISQLEFRSFEDNFRFLESQSVIKCQMDVNQQDMANRIESMEQHQLRQGQYNSLLQKLQIAKQLEYLSNVRDEHVLNTAKWLVDNDKVSMKMAALREVIAVGWAVYRYPVLGQVNLCWASAKLVIPAAADLFDEKIKANESLPQNVTEAQRSRLEAPCLRMSIEFPQGEPGDGDGLSELRVTDLHGLFMGDAAVPNTTETLVFRHMYPSEFAAFEGRPASIIERRSRLMGFDTQEAPRDPGRRDCDIPQPYWREGREFLKQELNGLRGEIPIDQARILGDCSGVDLYGRMLLDIRGVYDESDRVQAPTLRRLEMAERAIRSGYAFPTNHYFVTDNLWQAFQDAISQHKGGFSGDVEFIHPCICRRARHQLEVQVTRQRRHRYAE